MAEETPRLLTTAEVCDILKVKRIALQRWRNAGAGPNWIRVGRRGVRYPLSDLNQWLRDHQRAEYVS